MDEYAHYSVLLSKKVRNRHTQRIVFAVEEPERVAGARYAHVCGFAHDVSVQV